MPSPELRDLVDLLRQIGFGAETDITAMRTAMDQLGRTPVAGTVIEPAALGGVPGEWVRASDAASGTVVLYLHGGGYALGSPTSHRELASRLARAAGMPVYVPAYRLVPEHPCPAAVTDAIAVYRALRQSGLDASRIAIAGDSAGGGLALATVACLKAAGDHLPATVIGLSPWTDLALTGRSLVERHARDPILSAGVAAMEVTAKQYLGSADARDARASPLYSDYAGFPPLLLQVGTAEVLFDDAARVAARACAAGVPVWFDPWDDMIHVWHMFAGLLPEGQQAIDRIAAWLHRLIPVPTAGPVAS
jgi:monoterpene epsilon-lactone hydrolase